MQGCAWHCKTFNSAMFPKFPFDVRRSVARRRSVMFSILRSLSSEGKSILSPLPSQARVVICGGGIIGTSVAYHLAKLGWKDVVLLEQGRLGAGTTRLCAGIVSAVKQISIESKMASYSNNLYQQLEQETGIKTGM
ncbi:PDPR phosphatase, partial [Polypterus senegalus]